MLQLDILGGPGVAVVKDQISQSTELIRNSADPGCTLILAT